MKLHRGTARWGGDLFQHAVATQACEAEMIAEAYAADFGGRIARSNHPSSGPRPTPDDMLNAISLLYAPAGEGPSAFGEEEFRAAADLDPSPSVLSNAGETELTAEFPFFGSEPAVMTVSEGRSGQTSLFQAFADQRHLLYGSGCLLLHTLPLPDGDVGHANFLNRAESREVDDMYLQSLGAWCVGPLSVTHVCFSPAAAAMHGLVGTMMLYESYRGRWAKEKLFPDTSAGAPGSRSV